MDDTKQSRLTVLEQEMKLFRVIPDRSVSNHQNRRLWRLIHDLMAIDHSFKSRLKREGMRFTYQQRDRVYFDIVMDCREEKSFVDNVQHIEEIRTVNFYLCIPSKYADTFCHKLLDKNSQLTFEEIPLNTISISPFAEITEYRLQRNDIFSLRCNDNEEKTPIASFLNTAYDLQENDQLRLSFCLERMDRKKWSKFAEYAWGQLEKKKVPVRTRLDIGLLIRSFGDTSKYLFGELKSVIEDVMQGFQNVFTKSDHSFKTEKNGYQNSEYSKLMINGQISTDTKKKTYEPTFKTKIRLAITSNNRSRMHMINYSITNALSELSEDNILLPHKVSIRIKSKTIDEMNTFQSIINDKDVNVLSAKEIGKLHQFPTKELQWTFADLLTSKANVEIDIPKHLRDPLGILIGHSDYRGENIPVYIPFPKTDRERDEFMMSRVFIGSPRMGKDTSLVNFLVEAAKKGCGSVVIDVVNEKGNLRGLSDSLRDALPEDKLIDLDASDVNHPFYIGLNEVVSRSENAGNRLANDFATIFEVEDNGRTRTYLREAIKACNGDLLGVRLLLLSDGNDGDYLDTKIQELKKNNKHYSLEFWEAYRNESNGQKSEIRKPILNRLDEIFGDDHLKNMFGQKPNPNIDFAKWFKEGKVILIRVPNNHPDLSELSVKTICQWIVLKTFLTKLVMADKDCCSFLVLNEPHQFMSNGLVKVLGRMLRECPKWRLSMLFAIHDFSKSTIPKDLVDTMLSCSLNWHVFKNSNLNVYERMAHYLKPTYEPEDAMNQTAKYHSINLFFKGGDYGTPFMMKALQPVNERNKPYDNESITLKHSKQYGRTREEVEFEIFEREKVLFAKSKTKSKKVN